MVKFTVIACVNNVGAIGDKGKLLYRIKADMENFKALTMHNVVIMGRKTFESLPNQKPLKNRFNIIVTRNESYSVPSEFEDVYIVHSLHEARELCEAFFFDREIFIIGGSEIYKSAFDEDMVDKVVLTLVNDNTEGDSYFPVDMEKDNEKYRVIFKTKSLRDHPNDNYYRYIVYKKN